MAWRKILALSLLAGVAFAGCTVTTDDPDDDEDGGSGGRNSGGSSSGGAKSSGGSSSGGAKSSGGSGSGGDDGGPDSGPILCDPDATGKNECEKCVESKCCQEWLDCGDDVNCSYKSASQPGELICIQECLLDQFADAGAVDLGACDSACAEESSGSSLATSQLIACIRAVDGSDGGVLQACSTPCFGTEL